MESLVPQPDGLYALTFKNFQKVSEDEVREIFKKYGDVVNIRKSSEQVPWVFVRYKNYDEALKAYRDLQNCERFDIKVATSGKKSQDRGSEEKGTKGEIRDKGAPKVHRERNNFEDHSFSENTDDVSRSKEPSKFSAGRCRNFSKNLPREIDDDDDEEVKRNQTQMTGRSRNFSKNLPREVVEGDLEAKRNHIQLAGHSRNFSTHPPKEVGDDDLEGRRDNTKLSGRGRNFPKTSPKEVNGIDLEGQGRSQMQKMPFNRRKIPMEDDWEDDKDIGVEAAGRSLKQLSMHGVVRHRRGNSEDGESDVKSSNEGPPKLVKATKFYGALTLQHPYESGLACRAVFNEVWTNHPLRKEMELHEVVITNFDAIPTKNDIIRLCSGVTLLHVSVDVTPRNMPYCRVLVATEEDTERLYELDGFVYDGAPLYVSSLGYILDELAE